MSILLRKECQKILDNAGLNDLHVGTQEKNLAIKSSCGKALVVISGIEFATKSPKNAEIDYAVELFQKFMNEHTETLQEFVTKSRTFNELEDVTVPEDFERSLYYSTLKYKPNGKSLVVFHSDGKIDTGEALDFDILTEIVTTYQADVTEYFVEQAKYNAAQQEISDLRSSLASCDI